MEKATATINCPHCKTNNVTIVDNESLSCNDPSFFDTEMYAKAQCNDCKRTFFIQGTINWKQPVSLKRKVAKLVNVSITTRVVVDEDATDEQILAEAKDNLAGRLLTEYQEHTVVTGNDTECPYGTLNDEK